LLPLPVLGERVGERGERRVESNVVSTRRSLAPLPCPLPGVPGRGSKTFDIFHRDNTVRSVGEGCAGHDRNGLSAGETASGRRAGGDFTDDFEFDRNPPGVRSANGKSVHQRAIERGVIAIGADIFRKHESIGVLQRHFDHAR
jgi:hypothetical protein